MSLDALRVFVAQKMPMLNDAMSAMAMDDVRKVLNAATRLNLGSGESVHLGGAKFLLALEDADARGALTLGVLPRAMKAAKELRTKGQPSA